MALVLDDPETDSLVHQVADLTGETPVEVVRKAMRERLRQARLDAELARDLNEIALRCAALPVLDDRSEDEILGYDEDGIPAKW